MRLLCFRLVCVFIWAALVNDGLDPQTGFAQEANYDEQLVPAYDLPPVLQNDAGQPIGSEAEWTLQRKKLLEQFAAEMFGRRPTTEVKVAYDVRTLSDDPDGDGAFVDAIVQEVTLTLSVGARQQRWRMLLFLPRTNKSVPVFLGLNFQGNHTVSDHPEISLPEGWVGKHEFPGGEQNRASEEMRGQRASRWPWQLAVQQGFGVATIYYGDIDADYDDNFRGGVHELLREPGAADADWASISAWSWGLSRALDYLETRPEVDAKRVIVMGHSRLGKTALWAGATDERFAMVISNNSGCGGAALSRRQFGETVARINRNFPHWFNQRFKFYNDRENELPFDQHQLIACLAPRPVYITSASEDLWADPHGEFLSALHADPVYRLLGVEGLGITEFPEPNQPCLTRIGYHVRRGPHDITEYDWQQFIEHAKRHL